MRSLRLSSYPRFFGCVGAYGTLHATICQTLASLQALFNMTLSHTAVAQRARLVARAQLVVDLLLAIAFFLRDAPWPLLAAVGVDVLLLWPYLRLLARAPATFTLVKLTVTAALLALVPYVLGGVGLAAWVLLPLAPLSAVYVLGRRRQMWQMAGIVTAIVAAILLLVRGQVTTSSAVTSLGWPGSVALALAVVVAVWCAGWLGSHVSAADDRRQALLGEPLTVVRHVMVAPLQLAVQGVSQDALQQELQELRRQQAPQWIVVDLGPAGELRRHDLQAVEQAAAASSNANCTVVLARPPVDAVGHIDFAQPLVGRVERFATVPQAVEAGLRRLGWTQNPEQPQRVITIY